jgi:hypothetical protein
MPMRLTSIKSTQNNFNNGENQTQSNLLEMRKLLNLKKKDVVVALEMMKKFIQVRDIKDIDLGEVIFDQNENEECKNIIDKRELSKFF